MKKILILGANGKVGEALTTYLLRETNSNLVLLSRVKLVNVLNSKVYLVKEYDKKELKEIIYNEKPDVIVNCAAMTNVDGCETDREQAMSLNAALPETLAKISKVLGSHLITYSTDYIFDGRVGPYLEDDVPSPINYYGKSKLAGENAVKSTISNFTILRTNVVYGISNYGKGDFIGWAINLLNSNSSLEIITGQYCNPTLADDIAHATWKVIERKMYGTYNIAGKDYLNRYEIAIKICDVFEFNSKLVKAIPPASLKQKALRPEKGGLIQSKFEAETGFKFCSLDDGLYVLKNHEKNIK